MIAISKTVDEHGNMTVEFHDIETGLSWTEVIEGGAV